MRIARFAVLVTIALVLGACATMAEEDMMMGPVTYEGFLEAETPEDLRGAVRVNSTSANAAVAISIAGGPQGAVYPWHVHRGTCGSGGPIVGNPAAYPVLRTGMGMTSETARIDVPLLPGDSYYVNIHQSPQDLGTIVACMPLG